MKTETTHGHIVPVKHFIAIVQVKAKVDHADRIIVIISVSRYKVPGFVVRHLLTLLFFIPAPPARLVPDKKTLRKLNSPNVRDLGAKFV